MFHMIEYHVHGLDDWQMEAVIEGRYMKIMEGYYGPDEDRFIWIDFSW